MLAWIKMLQIMGYLFVVPPHSSRCHSNVSGVMREQAFSLSRVCYPPNVTSEVSEALIELRTNVPMRRLPLYPSLLRTTLITFLFVAQRAKNEVPGNNWFFLDHTRYL